MEIKELYKYFIDSNGVTTDTRKCGDGLMFFALKGENFDGNSFAKQALELGCLFAVVDSKDYYDSHDNRMILVESVLKTLQELANYHRRVLDTTVIGITGTNGKTTTKELIFAVLSQSFNVLATEGNLNNSIGVPLTVLKLKPEHQYAIIEMGASHPGDIRELVNVCEPNYGIITNVGKAHLLGFGSFEGVISTKGELYDYLREKRSNGKIFLNADNEYLNKIASGLHQIKYGKYSNDDDLLIYGGTTVCDPYLKFRWKKANEMDFHYVNTNLIGSYNVDNALAAITIGVHFGVPSEKISAAIEEYKPNNNRSQLTITSSNSLVVDAYNANPTSMMAALDNFKLMKADNKCLILGDMRELGDSSRSEHIGVLKAIREYEFSNVFLVGKEFGAVNKSEGFGFNQYDDVTALSEYLRTNPINNKTILLKGSNSIHLTKLIDFL